MAVKHPAWRMLIGRAAYILTPSSGKAPHFVRDYARLLRRLKADYARDHAMSLAVGGHYEAMGEEQVKLIAAMTSLKSGETLLDLGCGSGRLASAISRRYEIDYVGIDVLRDLLRYAALKSPPHYKFMLSREYRIPLATESFGIVCAFSLFTHLKHEEVYAYLLEAKRVLRPGGELLFSFLEFAEPSQWVPFEQSYDALLLKKRGITNTYIERSVISAWARRIGFTEPRFVGPDNWPTASVFGQSAALLRRLGA